MKYLAFLAVPLMAIMMSCSSDDNNVKNTSGDYIPTACTKGLVHLKGHKLESINSISATVLSDEEKVMLSTLEGIIAQSSGDQLYVVDGNSSATWLNEMQEAYNIPVKRFVKVSDILSHYASTGLIKGYIVYEPYKKRKSHSVNVATTLSGILGGIAVSRSLIPTVNQAGITNELIDVSDKDEKWLMSEYGNKMDKSLAADLTPEISLNLRDYMAMTRGFVFRDDNAKNNWSWRTSILTSLDYLGHCFGYYGADEWGMVNNASQLAVTMIPSDYAANLSTLSSIYDTTGLKQRPAAKDVETEENVHYVTFLVSDGDNVAFNFNYLCEYYSAACHGSFPLGFTLSPTLYDLAPAVMRWYFDSAKDTDYFVAGPSGSGYIFPSKMKIADLDAYLVRLNKYLDASGLNIVNILDQQLMEKPYIYNKYLAQPNIDAIFYTGYGEKGDGRIQFSDNGKPVIEQRSVLWANIDGGDRGEENSVIQQINSRPANPHITDGYTFVFVHCWSKDQYAIKRVVDGLNPNVRVVSPDKFVALIKQNLK